MLFIKRQIFLVEEFVYGADQVTVVKAQKVVLEHTS